MVANDFSQLSYSTTVSFWDINFISIFLLKVLSSLYCTYLEEMFLLRHMLEAKISMTFKIKCFSAISNFSIASSFLPTLLYLFTF